MVARGVLNDLFSNGAEVRLLKMRLLLFCFAFDARECVYASTGI